MRYAISGDDKSVNYTINQSTCHSLQSMAAVARGVVALMADHVGIDEATQKKLKIDQDWVSTVASVAVASRFFSGLDQRGF